MATMNISLTPELVVLVNSKVTSGMYHTASEETLDAKLHRWQQQDGMTLVPDISTQTLFAQWVEEDANMTEAEREAEDSLWNEMEKGLAENGGLQLRRLGE